MEPFTEKEMSPASREQMSVLLEDIYGHFLGAVGQDRDIPSDSLRLLADSLLIRQPADALRYGLVDGLKYKEELLTELKALNSRRDENEINNIKLSEITAEHGQGKACDS